MCCLFKFPFYAFCLALYAATALADVEDDFLRARQAHYARDLARFEKYAALIPPAHPLSPYLAYWRLEGNAGPASDDRITDFLATYPGSWLAERVRADWLKQLGRREMWPAFLAEYPRLASPDVTHQCYDHRAELAAGNRSRLKDAIALWFSGHDLPGACAPLFSQLISERLINREDVWRRQRLALEAGNPGVAQAVASALPPEDRMPGGLLDLATRSPARLFDARDLQLNLRQNRELALYALNLLAKISSAQAESTLRRVLLQFPETDQRYAWGQLATQAARRHEPGALSWFDLAGPAALSDAQREWWVRAALRAGQWRSAALAIDGMSDANRALPVWRYWRGRAFQAQGQTAIAMQWLTPLSREPHYYGQLALEELGSVVGSPAINIKVGGDELDAVLRDPGIQRGLSLFAMGLRSDATSEWNWAIRGFNDRQLLAAAEQARRVGWYDRAINTAERTRESHDFELRFIAPYREMASVSAAENKLDEAWVYGLIRQESRFISAARSGVGAAGLMQIMPDTARWIARRLGIKSFAASDMQAPETNIKFGTYYLKHVQDSLDGSPVLATAAYNAGPSRAQRWRASVPMEAAVYIETIPFTETRDYVRKVMSNAMYYAARFGQPSTLLKDRLGIIPARTSAALPSEPAVDDKSPSLETESSGG
jgi:soluble lytic murein transglycosylase